jgi:hypothetical protein
MQRKRLNRLNIVFPAEDKVIQLLLQPGKAIFKFPDPPEGQFNLLHPKPITGAIKHLIKRRVPGK